MIKIRGALNYTPAVILLLVATSVLFAGLFVKERSNNYAPAQLVMEQGQTQQQYNWRLVTTWPKNFPGLGIAPERFAQMVSDMSDGRLQIEVFGAGEIVPTLGVFDAVSSGSVEMGHGGAYYWKGKIPAIPFFTSVPFGLNAQEINAWFHYGGGIELWRELYEPFNVVPYAGGNTGVQMGGWFNKEINSGDDLKGLKMRLPGIAGEVLARAGGNPVNIPGGELYTSMQTGVIDATEWVGPYNDIAFGLHEVGRYYYYPGWHEPGSSMEFIVNRAALESLPADLQAIVEVATRAGNGDMLDEFTAQNSASLQDLKSNYPEVELRQFPQEVIDYLYEQSQEYYAEESVRDPKFAEVYNSFLEFQAMTSEWLEISESAYFEMRENAEVEKP